MLGQQPRLQIGSLALYRPTPHLFRMSDPVARLNAALEGRSAETTERSETNRNPLGSLQNHSENISLRMLSELVMACELRRPSLRTSR